MYECIVFSCRTENSQSLTDILRYLPKNMALLVQKLWRKKRKKCQNPFPAFLRRKNKIFCPLSRGGGLKALVDCPIKKKKKTFFLRLPLLDWFI